MNLAKFHVTSVNLLLLLSLQSAIALHESNGIDIVIALVLNDINPLGKQRMDLVLELKVRKAVVSLRMFSSYRCSKIWRCENSVSQLLRAVSVGFVRHVFQLANFDFIDHIFLYV